MSLVTLRNINPLGEVDLPLIGRQGDPIGVEGVGCLEPGEEFEVTAEQAGYPPTGEPGDADYDPGSGLLGQVGNYEHVAGELIQPDKVPAGAVDDVLRWVGDDPVKALSALEAENARTKPRSTLVERLTEIAKGDDQ